MPSLGRATQILNGGAKISGPKESHGEQDVNASLGRRGILDAGELRNSSKNQANKQQTKQESKPGDDSVWRPISGSELHQAVFAQDHEHSTKAGQSPPARRDFLTLLFLTSLLP